jgi:hypothetical protein
MWLQVLTVRAAIYILYILVASGGASHCDGASDHDLGLQFLLLFYRSRSTLRTTDPVPRGQAGRVSVTLQPRA